MTLPPQRGGGGAGTVLSLRGLATKVVGMKKASRHGASRHRGGRRRVASAALSVLMLAPIAGCDDEAPFGAPVRVEAVFGALGDTPGRFGYPRAMCADPKTDTLWIIDKLGRVQQLDARDGAVLAIWRMPEMKEGKPTGVTVGPGLDRDGDSLLYIADTHYNRVMIFRPPAPAPGQRHTECPELVASFGSYGNGPGEFIYPTDVAILPTPDGKRVERLYVGEYGGNDRVSVFDSSLRFLFSFGSYGEDASPDNIQFNRPQALEIDLSPEAQRDAGGRGRLVVADSRGNRVGVFTLEGKLLRWIGSAQTASREPGSFRIPYGLHLMGDGTALVAEFENCRVQRIDLLTGASLGAWGCPGRGDGQLASPWGVTTLGNRTFILDSGNNRVLEFETPRRRDS